MGLRISSDNSEAKTIRVCIQRNTTHITSVKVIYECMCKPHNTDNSNSVEYNSITQLMKYKRIKFERAIFLKDLL